MSGAPGRRGQGVIWVMRMGILAMISVGLAVLYQRYHLTDEQADLLRYVETDVMALRKVEDPIEEGLSRIIADRTLSRERMRSALVDEMVPALLRLRKLAEAPLREGRTPRVRELGLEYQGVIDQFIDACRTAVRVMDDPQVGGREGVLRVTQGFTRAAEASRRWEEHVKAISQVMRLHR